MSSVELILFIITFLTLMLFSLSGLLKAMKKVKSKKTGEKREGIQKLNRVANENVTQGIVETGLHFFKNLF